MISNQWYGILDAKELKTGRPVGVTRVGEKLVLWRKSDGSIGCLADPCCHRGAALSAGMLVEAPGQTGCDAVRCPFHGFVYDSTGKVLLIPANGKNEPVPERYRVRAYTVVESDDFIWLWYAEDAPDPADLPPVPFFTELRKVFSHGGFSETWPVHYTRAIENQLDVVHLPFVHTNTIGRGNRTLVHGPVVVWDENQMTFYVYNVEDDGQTRPLKPQEIRDFQNLFSLQFQMPNLWQNRISDDIRIVAVFAPIDESHTRIYIRFYQRFMRVPGLRELVNWLSNFSNRIILHQDRRVVVTQRPIRSELRMSEKLIQGDAPILAYRRRRAELKGEVKGEVKSEAKGEPD